MSIPIYIYIVVDGTNRTTRAKNPFLTRTHKRAHARHHHQSTTIAVLMLMRCWLAPVLMSRALLMLCYVMLRYALYNIMLIRPLPPPKKT